MAVETMSVRNMGRLLGLKKVESYWLVHKEWFETILVNGKMRVVTESFETWYNSQYHYRKLNGPPPSCGYMSVRQIARMLGLADATAYDLVKKEYFESIIVDGKIVIINDSFEKWYRRQNRYVKKGSEKESAEPQKNIGSAVRAVERKKPSLQVRKEKSDCSTEQAFSMVIEERLKEICKKNRAGRKVR